MSGVKVLLLPVMGYNIQMEVVKLKTLEKNPQAAENFSQM